MPTTDSNGGWQSAFSLWLTSVSKTMNQKGSILLAIGATYGKIKNQLTRNLQGFQKP